MAEASMRWLVESEKSCRKTPSVVSPVGIETCCADRSAVPHSSDEGSPLECWSSRFTSDEHRQTRESCDADTGASGTQARDSSAGEETVGTLGTPVCCDDLTWPFSPHSPAGDSKDICSSCSLARVPKAVPRFLCIEEEQRTPFVSAGEPLIEDDTAEAIPEFAGDQAACDEGGSWPSSVLTRSCLSVLMPEEGVAFLGCRRDAVGRGWAWGWRGPGMAEGCFSGCCSGQPFTASTFASSDVNSGRFTAVEFSEYSGLCIDGGGSLSRSLNSSPTLTRCTDGFCFRSVGFGFRGRCGCSETLGCVIEGEAAAMSASEDQAASTVAREEGPDLQCTNTLTNGHSLEECIAHEADVALQKGLEGQSSLPREAPSEEDMSVGASGQGPANSENVGFLQSTHLYHQAQKDDISHQRRRQYPRKSITEKGRRQHQGRQPPPLRRGGSGKNSNGEVKSDDWGLLSDLADSSIRPERSEGTVRDRRHRVKKTVSQVASLHTLTEQQPETMWNAGGGPPLSSSGQGTTDIIPLNVCDRGNLNANTSGRLRTRKTSAGASVGKGSRCTGVTAAAREAVRGVHARSLINKPQQRRRHTQQQRRGQDACIRASDGTELHGDASPAALPENLRTEHRTGNGSRTVTSRIGQPQAVAKVEWETLPLLLGQAQPQATAVHAGCREAESESRDAVETDSASVKGMVVEPRGTALSSSVDALVSGSRSARPCREVSKTAATATATATATAGIGNASGGGGGASSSRRKSRAATNGPAAQASSSPLSGWGLAELSSIPNTSQSTLISGAPATWHEQPNAGLLLSSAFSYLSVKNAEPLFSSRWKSGCEGVYFDYQKGLWRVQFLQDGRRRTKSFSPKHLGSSEAAKFAAMVYRIKMVETQDNVSKKIEELKQEWNNAHSGVVGASSSVAETTPEGQSSDLAAVEALVDMQGQRPDFASSQSTACQQTSGERQSGPQQRQQQQQPEPSAKNWKAHSASLTGKSQTGFEGQSNKDEGSNRYDTPGGLYTGEEGSASAAATATEAFGVPMPFEENKAESTTFVSLPSHVDNSLQGWCHPSTSKAQEQEGTQNCDPAIEGDGNSGTTVCTSLNQSQQLLPLTRAPFTEGFQTENSAT